MKILFHNKLFHCYLNFVYAPYISYVRKMQVFCFVMSMMHHRNILLVVTYYFHISSKKPFKRSLIWRRRWKKNYRRQIVQFIISLLTTGLISCCFFFNSLTLFAIHTHIPLTQMMHHWKNIRLQRAYTHAVCCSMINDDLFRYMACDLLLKLIKGKMKRKKDTNWIKDLCSASPLLR